jgi:ABC-type phosphate/phosphonate transport system substrate-binding protein
MTRGTSFAALILVALCLVTTTAFGQVDDGRKFLICHTGSVTTAEEAQPYIDGFGGYLARKLGWQEGTWEVKFANKRQDGNKALSEWAPSFAALALGIFLEQEGPRNLVPLVLARINGKTTNKYYVLVAKGSATTLADLKGKKMAGSILDDTTFLTKVVFAGELDAATHFDLKQTKRPLRAIRKVARGKLDAALVDDVQLQSLKGLPLFDKLSVVYESAEVPNLGMVYVKGRAADVDIKKFTDALANMCQDTEGKKMCETFAVEEFVPIPAGALDGVRKLYK